jgi:hypothetical protein
MSEPQKFDTHVCLVSDQATPNLLPLLDERWRPRRVVLATSAAMQARSAALAGLLQTKGVKVETLALRNVYDYSSLCDDLQGFLDAGNDASLALNVTGGTKLMAMAAQEVFRAYERPAFYVSIETDEIVFLSGGHSAPLNTKLKIVESLRAHGYATQGGETPQVTAAQRDLAARLIDHVSTAGRALGQINGLAQQAKPSLRCQMTEAEFDSKALSHMLALFADAGYVSQAGTALTFPDEASRFFVNGGWLEYHLLQVLRDLQGTHPVTDIAFNLKVIRPGGDTDNEIDVAFMYRNTLHIIECKSANLARAGATQDDKATEAVYRMESLLKLGGLRTRGMIVDYRGAFAASDANRKRAKAARIEILSGSELKDAKGQIGRRWMNAPA